MTSPSQMLKKRYKINEPITDATDIIYGFDQMSKMPKNLKVMIRVYRSQPEYQRQTQLFKNLRSHMVSTLLDFWEENGLGFIVLERGSYTVDQYLVEMQGKIDLDTKKYILLDMISTWIFLYQYGYYSEFKPEDFMWYGGGHWKLINCANVCPFSEIIQNPGDQMDFIHVDRDVVIKVINFEHSQVLHDPDVPIQSLGMMLLELFLMSPVLANKGYEDLTEDLRKGALMSFVTTEEDKSIFEILKHIILQNKHEQDEQNQLILHIDALIKIWNNNSTPDANEIKKNPGKYIKKAGAF
ncbi:UNKNOWN [Stylonychia lemnae]|uniref:Protein kinase domain-containing protein n=1 Tax=Stylonychia lemnae TaxID=5949 RepID=A0A078B8P4_STYLE|nr:UNKNOWN [Stylonychia lemnae]|eukprot:CDW89682.1 UNKNOWN [Stylonychia lemnae]